MGQRVIAGRWGPTSVGLDANIAAGLSYLIPIIGVIFFFMEKKNRFLKFHSAQAILVIYGLGGLAYTAFAILDGISMALLGGFSGGAPPAGNMNGGFGFALFILPVCVLSLAFPIIGVLFIWGMVAAFTGKYVKLPIVGGLADRWASRLPMPTI